MCRKCDGQDPRPGIREYNRKVRPSCLGFLLLTAMTLVCLQGLVWKQDVGRLAGWEWLGPLQLREWAMVRGMEAQAAEPWEALGRL